MSDALVLNAGASWAAFQVGALRHVVAERRQQFDVHAGTGIGAMNAAFVACGQFDALLAWWASLRRSDLVRPTARGWWRGPLSGAPQRHTITAHVSEERLAARGATLLINTLDIRAGTQRVWEYPGAEMPLIDALMAAVATAGLVAPVAFGLERHGEGTFVESFLLREVLARGPARVLAIAVTSPRSAPTRRYRTWHAVAGRALALNLDHDVWSALAYAGEQTATTDAHRRARAALTALVAERVADPAAAAALTARIAEAHSERPAAAVTAITPSRELGYSMFQFARRRLDAAMALGYADARSALSLSDPP